MNLAPVAIAMSLTMAPPPPSAVRCDIAALMWTTGPDILPGPLVGHRSEPMEALLAACAAHGWRLHVAPAITPKLTRTLREPMDWPTKPAAPRVSL